MAARMPIRLAAGSGVTFGVDDIACAAASYLGFWDQEGLDVTWKPCQGGVAAMKAALAREVDVAYAGLGPVINLRAQGNPCRIIVSMARALAQNLVVQKRITSAKDLSGVSWAIDAFNAMSHHMARLTVRALGIPEADIRWQAVGPPPERIEALLSGASDVSLIRVEEATSLGRTQADKVHTLLAFSELKRLVPTQPHGVLATTEAYEKAHGEELHRLTRGMIRASRALHDEFESFFKVFRHQVTLPVTDDEVRAIWQREHDSGGFAVNGELTLSHWKEEMGLYFQLYPDIRRVTRAELISETFVPAALTALGVHPALFDQPGT
jgi:ABC-type nitrate/sulfonate/bicarbonate transport system substrate-binding protein